MNLNKSQFLQKQQLVLIITTFPGIIYFKFLVLVYNVYFGFDLNFSWFLIWIGMREDTLRVCDKHFFKHYLVTLLAMLYHPPLNPTSSIQFLLFHLIRTSTMNKSNAHWIFEFDEFRSNINTTHFIRIKSITWNVNKKRLQYYYMVM